MRATEKIKEVNTKLISAGISDRLEAEWLIALALGKNKLSEIYNLSIMKDDEEKIDSIVKDRINGKPLAYAIGNAEFYGRKFDVNQNVLIPRPETELLVERIIKDIKENPKKLKVLDIGTGSGAIAITISLETDAIVKALDISHKALKVAINNGINLKSNVEFCKSDIFSEIKDLEKFDIIVSNPPYIKSEDINGLDKEVRDFEPHLALDGGESGLEIYERIIKEAPKFLNPNGKINFEIGIGQADDIKKMLERDFECIEIIKDYNNIDRIVVAKLRVRK